MCFSKLRRHEVAVVQVCKGRFLEELSCVQYRTCQAAHAFSLCRFGVWPWESVVDEAD